MKTLKIILSLLFLNGLVWSCTTTTNSSRNSASNKVYRKAASGKKIPPGQAKKVFGGEATDYAPGQVKKRK